MILSNVHGRIKLLNCHSELRIFASAPRERVCSSCHSELVSASQIVQVSPMFNL